jgi:hypothetical protein
VERVFGVAEAQALLPTLTKLLTDLQAAYRELMELVPSEGERIAGGNGSASAASALSAAERRYMTLLREVDALGVVVRDPESGLVDFAATHKGKAVYLCWRLGESTIGFWHPRDTGIAGRQPL